MGGIASPVDDPTYVDALKRTVTAFEHAIATHRALPYDGACVHAGEPPAAGRARFRLPRHHFHGPCRALRGGRSHKQVLDPQNADFARHLAHCLDLIRSAAMA
jgi:hypothetical protein